MEATPAVDSYSSTLNASANWRDAIMSIAGFWALYYVLNTIHMALTDHPDQVSFMIRRAGVVAIGFCLTYLLYLILRRLEGVSMRVLVPAVFIASVPIAAAYGT